MTTENTPNHEEEESRQKTKSGLDILGLPAVFSGIADGMQTGTLMVQGEQEIKYIYFREGKIQQVSSPQRASLLDEGMRRHPDLDDETYQILCERQRETGQPLSAILLAEEGGEEMVIAVCQFQITEEISEIFIWPHVHCEFSEEEPSPLLFDVHLLKLPIDMNANAVLMEAARRYDEWQLIRQVLPSDRDIPYLTAETREEDFPEQARVIYPLINGGNDIQEIVDKVRLSPFATMKILAELIQQGKVALKTGKELLQMASLDLYRKDMAKCIKLYERAESLGEKNIEAIAWSATYYEMNGLKDKAAEKYRQLGSLHAQEGRSDGAVEAFTKVTQLTPEDLAAHKRLIELLYVTDRLEEAATHTSIYVRRLTMEGQRQEAIKVLENAEDQGTLNAENMELLARLYEEEGEREKAIKTYEMLGNYLARSNALEEALRIYLNILRIDRDNYRIRMAFANTLSNVGHYEQALSEYKDLGGFLHSTEAYKEESVGDLQIQICNHIISCEQNNINARKWLCDVYIERGHKDKAILLLHEILPLTEDLEIQVECLKKLCELEPERLSHRQKLAEAFISLHKYREAAQEYFTLGSAAASSGDKELAKDAFNRLLRLEPSNLAGRSKKVEILLQEKEHPEAVEEAVAELKLIGDISRSIDKAWQAVDAFINVVKLKPEEELACYLELGRLYQRLGNSRKALLAYQKHVEQSVRVENYGDALRTCEKILRLHPDHNWTLTIKKRIERVLESIRKELRHRRTGSEVKRSGSEVKRSGSEVKRSGSEVKRSGSEVKQQEATGQNLEVPGALSLEPPAPGEGLRLDPSLALSPGLSLPSSESTSSSPNDLRLDQALNTSGPPQLTIDPNLLQSLPTTEETSALKLDLSLAPMSPTTGLRIDPALTTSKEQSTPPTALSKPKIKVASESSSPQIPTAGSGPSAYNIPVTTNRRARGAARRRRNYTGIIITVVAVLLVAGAVWFILQQPKRGRKHRRTSSATNTNSAHKPDKRQPNTIYQQYQQALQNLHTDPASSIKQLDALLGQDIKDRNLVARIKVKRQEAQTLLRRKKQRQQFNRRLSNLNQLIVQAQFDQAWQLHSQMAKEDQLLKAEPLLATKLLSSRKRLEAEAAEKYEYDLKNIQQTLKQKGEQAALKLLASAAEHQLPTWRIKLQQQQQKIAAQLKVRQEREAYQKQAALLARQLVSELEQDKSPDYQHLLNMIKRFADQQTLPGVKASFTRLAQGLEQQNQIMTEFQKGLKGLEKKAVLTLSYVKPYSRPCQLRAQILYYNIRQGTVILKDLRTGRAPFTKLTDFSAATIEMLFHKMFPHKDQKLCTLLLIRLGHLQRAQNFWQKFSGPDRNMFMELTALRCYLKAMAAIENKEWETASRFLKMLSSEYAASILVLHQGIRGGGRLIKKAQELLKGGRKNKVEQARQILMLIIRFYDEQAKEKAKKLLQ